jgi:perosamine synthetase
MPSVDAARASSDDAVMHSAPGDDPDLSVTAPAWPPLDDEIRTAISAALENGSWGKYSGGNVEAFEADLAAYHGVAHAMTCASGTLAVELALHAVGVGPGDEVILSAYDFPGNFLTIHALGATPVLVDVAFGSIEPSAEAIASAIGPAVRAVLVSHLHGALLDMPAITEICRRHAVAVVEDTCQCPGATVAGRRAGTWGDVGVLSFGGSKTLTAGRGGAVVTANATVAQRIRQRQFRGNVVGPLAELQAAVLRPQLAKLDERNAARQRAVELLTGRLADLQGLRPIFGGAGIDTPAYYKVGFLLSEAEFGLSRAAFVAKLRAAGVAVDEGFAAAHVGRSAKRFRAARPLANAEQAGREVVILHHPVLLAGPDAIEAVARAIRSCRPSANAAKPRES